MMRMGPHGLLGSDPSKIEGVTLRKGVVRRSLEFARPYRWMLVGYVLVIVLEALIALVPVLLVRRIIDVAIPEHDRAGGHGAGR